MSPLKTELRAESSVIIFPDNTGSTLPGIKWTAVFIKQGCGSLGTQHKHQASSGSPCLGLSCYYSLHSTVASLLKVKTQFLN